MENISYITNKDLLRKSINEASAIIEKTQFFMASHDEGIEDYRQYVAKGVNYRVMERIEATEKYLTDTNAPSWLHDGYKQRSVESLGNELTYYNMLQAYIPMRITLNSETLFLDVNTDITITESGKWEASEVLKEKIRERYTRTLTENQMQDFQLCQDFLVLYRKLYAKGYDLHNPKHLANMTNTETLAHSFVSVYSQIIDERIDPKEREQLRLKALGYIM